MTRFFSLRFLVPTFLALTLAVHAPAFAQEGKPTESVTRAEAIKASDRANAEKPAIPTKAEPGAKRDETHTGQDPITKDTATAKDAKAMTPASKSAAIHEADSITKFDASRVIGAAKHWQMYYQPASSPIMEKAQSLHDGIQIVISLIVLFVLGLLLTVIVKFNRKANPKPQTFTHNKTVEIVWTVIPILILVGIAIPSIRLHYNYYNNETIINNPDVTIKVVGHQWYWSYEYPDQKIAFDSNIKGDKELAEDEPRLLAVDNPIVVPVNKVVRIQLTSADVIHAWAIPAFGIKKAPSPAA